MDELKIGTVNFDGGAVGTRGSFHKINPGDNLFRVLPPLFSLAEVQKYAIFYSTHEVYGSNGKKRKFRCVQEKDHKTKTIIRHCPFCDLYEQNTERLKLVKASNKGTKEDYDRFEASHIAPYKPDKKFYLNAVDANGKVGLLPIGYKMFQDLDSLIKKLYKEDQIDATGIKGLFLNFEKVQKFKGDRDTTYKVSVAYEKMQDGSMRYKTHEMAPAFIQSLKTQATDLSLLFKVITPEEVSALSTAQGEDKKALVDRIFARPEKDDEDNANAFETTIPGTTAKAVASVTVDSSGFNVSSPDISGLTDSVTSVQAIKPAPVQSNPFVKEKAATKPASAKVEVASPNVDPTKLSDDDFLAFMGAK